MSRYNSDKRHRRSIRLRGYDYNQPGAYFITIVTQGRMCLFGEAVDRQMVLNDVGQMVELVGRDLPNRSANIELDAYVVMSNHIHGIIVIHGKGTPCGCPPRPVGATLGVAPKHG